MCSVGEVRPASCARVGGLPAASPEALQRQPESVSARTSRGRRCPLTRAPVARETLTRRRRSVFLSSSLRTLARTFLYYFHGSHFLLSLKCISCSHSWRSFLGHGKEVASLPVHLVFVFPYCVVFLDSHSFISRAEVCGVREPRGLTEWHSPPAWQQSWFRRALWHRAARSAFGLWLQGCLPRRQTGPLCARLQCRPVPHPVPALVLLCPVALSFGCASQFPVRPSWSVRWVWGVGFPVSPVSLQGPAPDWTLWGLCRAQQRRCALQRSLPRLLCPTALFWVPRPAPRPSCRAKRTSPGGEGVLRPQCRRPGSLLCRVGTAEHRSPCSF